MSELNQYSYQQAHDRKIAENICVAATVKVIAFDKKKMTVNVQPLSKHLEHGKYESQPPILRVPVMCMKTGGSIVRPWIKEGDVGLVVYLDHDLDSTVSGGNSFVAVAKDYVRLKNEGSFIEITKDSIRLKASMIYLN